MIPSKTLRDYLRERAAWVWNEQGHAFDHGLTLQEETLTEMLLLRMARDHAKHCLQVTMFTKTEEGVNGADWEWLVRTPSCELGLRIQAKRLYHRSTGKDYGGLGPTSPQVDKLISRAKGLIPLYVFYNHDRGLNSKLLPTGTDAPYRGRSYWGCSFATAQNVKAANSNKLINLRKHLQPWHRLLSESGKCMAGSLLGIAEEQVDEGIPEERREVYDRIRDPDFMSKYLSARELAGVALLDLSAFRGE